MVVVVSRKSMASQWVQLELGMAEGLNIKIIPWLIEKTQPKHPLLDTYHYTRKLDEVVKQLKELIWPSDVLPVLVCGSANLEYVGEFHDGDVQTGSKNTIELHELSGGSGVNYSARLLSSGQPVIPILPVDEDDRGKTIKSYLAESARNGSIPSGWRNRIEGDGFFMSNAGKPQTSPGTPFTFILVDGEGSRRTIFSEAPCNPECYQRHIKTQIASLTSERVRLGALMIGHIYADAEECSKGACTKLLIDKCKKDSLIYVTRPPLALDRLFTKANRAAPASVLGPYS